MKNIFGFLTIAYLERINIFFRVNLLLKNI